MRRDAFTLIELLIVLGILVGIVGVAMLSLADFRREAEFRAVADRMESVGELARAEALRHGQPVELILRDASDARTGATRPMRVVTRRLDPVRTASSTDASGDADPAPAQPRTELPRWIAMASESDTDGRPGAARAAGSPDTRLAVFLSDGSALGVRSVSLEDTRSGARMTMTIDEMTGVCRCSIDWNPSPEAEAEAGGVDGLREPEGGGR
ncbi:MAG: prepilin-type N-terminal cleavage/methylation domain-containing protein [Phycisphaeraceae bacterium]|nr:prepilin-type N-terminal cleavage/methylation domain-containing protein [Phycisphaerales bacterium]MCB9843281.1 prepilin-type N-terminal cleavage/methylation domain-containing protein [Phycisphaeraceae bacterium]